WERVAFNNEVLEILLREAAKFEHYLQKTDRWIAGNKPKLRKKKIVYFSAEFGMKILKIYSGGLGILSGDHVRGASDIGLEGFSGVGLLYKSGYFRQKLAKDGTQKDVNPDQEVQLKIEDTPLEAVKDPKNAGQDLILAIPFPGRKVLAKVWEVMYGKTPLYLLDTDIEGNSPEDRKMVRSLYGSNNGTYERLQQYYVLGVGGMMAMQALGVEPDVLHMNDCHPMFSALQQLSMLMNELPEDERWSNAHVRFEMALHKTRARTAFTTHTPISAGNETLDPHLLRSFLETIFPNNDYAVNRILSLGVVDGYFNIAVFLQNMSTVRNAVSAIHGDVARGMWKPRYPGVKAEKVPIRDIVNSVHMPFWQDPRIAEYFQRVFKDPEVQRLMAAEDPTELNKALQDPKWMKKHVDAYVSDDEFWSLHTRMKGELMKEARRSLQERISRGDATKDDLAYLHSFDDQAFTIGFARRSVKYKRAALIFQDLKRLARIAVKMRKPLQLIFAGKAHPQDHLGKDLIRQLHADAQRAIREAIEQEGLKGVNAAKLAKVKFVFLEEYNIDLARFLESGVDVWLNTPVRPLEASGTSGMKAASNGVLNMSIQDGWEWQGVFDGVNGFLFGSLDREGNDLADGVAFYDVLEKAMKIYYNNRSRWIRMAKAAVISTTYRFGMERMLREYSEKVYGPTSDAKARMTDEEAYRLYTEDSSVHRNVLDHKDKWQSVFLEDFPNKALAGEEVEFSVILNLDGTVPKGVSPDSLAVDLLLEDERGVTRWFGMEGYESPVEGEYRYVVKAKAPRTGKYKVKYRITPRNPSIWHSPDELAMVTRYVESPATLQTYDKELLEFRAKAADQEGKPIPRGMLFYLSGDIPQNSGIYFRGDPNHWPDWSKGKPSEDSKMAPLGGGLFAIVIPEEKTRDLPRPVRFQFYVHLPEGTYLEDPSLLYTPGTYPT
ncbi:MAG: alpha-glucan family phosphorylase, partial [Candidatus Omnitrophota bacterium]